ncbi:MAG TPA: sigma-E factor negative regulatory protein [Burkholderiales bacterium]|nr:sigma-E factor negative regulatory protein [Burkholderiales bacterium]
MDRISALMDGELDEQEAQRVLAGIKSDPELRIRWDEFHLVRDALRAEPLLSSRFSESLSRRLADEPTVLAPQRRLVGSRRAATYAMSAAASVCAVAFVAWVAVGTQTTPESLPVAVKEPAPEPLRSVPSDGRMSEYLLAHERFSPSTALQGLAPYIRTVSTTRAADRR